MKNKTTTIILSAIYTVILFIMFIKEHLGIKTYFFLNNINNYIKISAKSLNIISLSIGLILLFISSIIICKMFSKYIEKDIKLGIISTGVIYSPFIIEFFLSPESISIASLSILLCVLSIKNLNIFFEKQKKIYFVVSILLGIICALLYINIICFISIIGILFTILNYKNKKDFLKQNIIIIGICIIELFITLITYMILGNTINLTELNITNSIKIIMDQLYILTINSLYIFPNYFLVFISLLLVILSIFDLIKQNQNKKILLNIYFVVIEILISILSIIFANYNSISITPRNSICIGLIPISLLIIFLYNNNNHENKYSTISIVIMILSIVLQLIGWYQIREDHYYTYVADRTDTTEILNNIKKYEIDNKETIKKIAIAYDKNTKFSYDEVEIAVGDINSRAFVKEIGAKNIINYYSDVEYEFIEPTKELKEYCSKNDWDVINKKSFRFEKDTLYMCIY